MDLGDLGKLTLTWVNDKVDFVDFNTTYAADPEYESKLPAGHNVTQIEWLMLYASLPKWTLAIASLVDCVRALKNEENIAWSPLLYLLA